MKLAIHLIIFEDKHKMNDNNEFELIYSSNLTEITEEFLSSVGYPHTHKNWSEWETLAREYGLNNKEIGELKQFLELNQQLTTPVRFCGKQLWLTKQEIDHLNLIKQYFSSWEYQVEKIISKRLLGHINKDNELKDKIK